MTATGETKMHQRPDGRTYATLRPLSSSLSMLTRADGSAKFSCGQTSILAAVFGPIAPRIEAHAHMSRAKISVVISKRSCLTHNNTGNVQEMEFFIANALSACIMTEQYPRTIIEVVVEVLKGDGSILSATVNASVLALMDAGLMMRSLPIATTCVISNNSIIKLDPTADEELEDGSASVVLVTESNINAAPPKDGANANLIGSTTFGLCTTPEKFLACVEAASRASSAVVAFMRLVLEQKLERESVTLWSDS
mmetsp:Transcript_12802/g.19385  ORF Transcript_12802/g.19385 Transcript_12802/m.19385 type:complete len:253 (+) Transcript_12802:143-901(+)